MLDSWGSQQNCCLGGPLQLSMVVNTPFTWTGYLHFVTSMHQLTLYLGHWLVCVTTACCHNTLVEGGDGQKLTIVETILQIKTCCVVYWVMDTSWLLLRQHYKSRHAVLLCTGSTAVEGCSTTCRSWASSCTKGQKLDWIGKCFCTNDPGGWHPWI